MHTVHLSLNKHRQQQVILIKSPADKELTAAIKLIKTSKWSQTLRTWYVPYSIEVLHEIKKLLSPLCTIDAQQLKQQLDAEKDKATKNEYINTITDKLIIRRLTNHILPIFTLGLGIDAYVLIIVIRVLPNITIIITITAPNITYIFCFKNCFTALGLLPNFDKFNSA